MADRDDKRDCNPTVLTIVDRILSVTWGVHLVVAVWRGTWNLLDLYVLPGDIVSGTWISYFGGIILCTAVKASYPILHRSITQQQQVTRFIISHVMLYIATWGTIGQWRGIWHILDRFMDVEWKSNAVTLAVSLVILWFLKASTNLVGPPFVLQYDLRKDIFVSVPRLKTSPSRYWDYIIDHCLGQLLIESLVTCAWRSLWNIFNDVVIPQNFLYSNLVTWSAGIVFVVLLLLIEKPVAFLAVKSGRCGFGCKLLIGNLYILLCFAATVALWRGWWNILEGILIKGMLLGGVTCHCVGLFLMFCTCTSTSLIATDFTIDGERTCAGYWSIEYCQAIYKHRLKSRDCEKMERDENKNDQDTLLKEKMTNGNYLKCSPDLEFEDLQLTSI